jgi:tRNA-2-methylthio-N6-dimethylallyladenosine synthase
MPKTAPIGVGLGLPSIGAPAPLPVETGCTA